MNFFLSSVMLSVEKVSFPVKKQLWGEKIVIRNICLTCGCHRIFAYCSGGKNLRSQILVTKSLFVQSHHPNLMGQLWTTLIAFIWQKCMWQWSSCFCIWKSKRGWWWFKFVIYWSHVVNPFYLEKHKKLFNIHYRPTSWVGSSISGR